MIMQIGISFLLLLSGPVVPLQMETIRIQVLDSATGTPVEGAKIALTLTKKGYLKQLHQGLSPDDRLRTVAAAGGGVYSADSVFDGEYLVFVQAPGYALWMEKATLRRSRQTAFSVELTPSPILRGEVVDALSRPVVDAMVRAVFTDRQVLSDASEALNLPGWIVPSAETDAAGGFELRSGLPPGGGYVLEVATEERLPSYLKVPEDVESTWQRLLIGERGFQLRGVILDEQGRGVPGAQIKVAVNGWTPDSLVGSLSETDQSGPPHNFFAQGLNRAVNRLLTAGEDGSFSLDNLPPGEADILVHAENYEVRLERCLLREPESFVSVHLVGAKR